MINENRSSKGRDSGSDSLREALRHFIRARGAVYLDDPNVTSVGVGLKNGDGAVCLVFTVEEKANVSVLEGMGTKKLPKSVDVEGHIVRTDVVQRSYRSSLRLIKEEATDVRKSRVEPLLPGVSVSHVAGTAGTIGAIVFDTISGTPCILSNWHVLHGNLGSVGDKIVQPGPFDNNDVSDNVCGELLRSHVGAAGDCALAKIRRRAFKREILDLNVAPKRLADVDIGDKVIKSGRTTNITRGIVRRIDVMAKIDYKGSTGVVAVGCFEIGVDASYSLSNGEISMGGDSGSVWMMAEPSDAKDVLAGLHFAGEGRDNPDEHALACYPKSIQKKLGFSLEPPASVTIDGDDLEAVGYRTGFDENFLSIRAPMPQMDSRIKRDALSFRREKTIPYTHFSVCLSKVRRLARFVAWNVDGARRVVLGRHRFRFDERIKDHFQHGNALYENNSLDRGHIARRADLAWGRVKEAKQANRDSFFFTNIAPQHERFNQSKRGGIWGRLENLILEKADLKNIRLSVIGGPIFESDDPRYRDTRIPRDYWKLVAYRESNDTLSCACFVLSQSDLVRDIEQIDLDPFRLYQVSVADLSDRTRLDFSAYFGADVFVKSRRRKNRPLSHELAEGEVIHGEIDDERQIIL